LSTCYSVVLWPPKKRKPAQIIALLENEKLIQSEIDRRRETAGKTDPCERRKEILRSEQARLRNKMERLITAYQDGLLSLEQLRERMPNLKQQSQAVNSELQLLEMEKLDQAKYLKLAQSLGGISQKTACAGANAGCERAPADLALARERNPGWL
jgi:site-specific DNA recombinase